MQKILRQDDDEDGDVHNVRRRHNFYFIFFFSGTKTIGSFFFDFINFHISIILFLKRRRSLNKLYKTIP